MSDTKTLFQASLVWNNPVFQAECKTAKDEMYAECIEAIKRKDYVAADAINSGAEALQIFFTRFEQMAERYKELTESDETQTETEEDNYSA